MFAGWFSSSNEEKNFCVRFQRFNWRQYAQGGSAISRTFEVVGLAVQRNVSLLEQRIRQFHPQMVSVADEILAQNSVNAVQI